MADKWGDCIACGERHLNHGRGLCYTCHGKAKRNGTLDSYKSRVSDREANYALVASLPASDCWPWPGPLDDDGYGRAGRQGRAHRWTWARVNGPIPEGLTIDHACHNLDSSCKGGPNCGHRRCVNPGHLRAVTRGDNVRASPNTVNSINALKEQCPQGHPYRGSNLVIVRGSRTCRLCNNEKARRYRARKRAAHVTTGVGCAVTRPDPSRVTAVWVTVFDTAPLL